jgi:phosphoribosylformylglycinamidine cyclo-ligase
MARTFNCGIGMVAIVAPDAAATVTRVLTEAGEQVHPIGRVIPRPTAGGGTIIIHAEAAWPG